jgi:hypothetical protein
MKHTILFVAANPQEMKQIALQQECAAIEDELRRTSQRDDFDFHSAWAVSVDALMRYLNQLSPTILHFSGHGAGRNTGTHLDSHRDIESLQGAGIFLEDGQQHQYVSEWALAQMIATASPATRLVVLNACYTAAIADSLRQFVDCVIGIRGAIQDPAAHTFATALYRALGHGRSVGNAAAQAVAALYAKQQSEHLPICRTRDGLVAEKMFLVGPGDTSNSGETPPPEPGSSRLDAASDSYDLFVAHPPATRSTAAALFDLLQPHVRVFLAGRSLQPSDHWEHEILTAQRAARATVLLISPQSDAAWYLSDELITAIAMHRASPRAHRLLPVLLEPNITLPLSISHIAPIDAVGLGGVTGIAALLRAQVAEMRRQAPPPPSTRPGASAHRRGVDHRDRFALYERLGQLTDSVFEQIMSRTGIERTRLASHTATLDQRALDVAQLAALDPMLSRRLSVELDRRAPWTRR